MVLNISDLSILTDNLVQFFTGSYGLLGFLICVVFLLFLLGAGIEFKYAINITLPLLAFFVAIGWFATITNNQWIINIALIVVSVIYGSAMVKLLT